MPMDISRQIQGIQNLERQIGGSTPETTSAMENLLKSVGDEMGKYTKSAEKASKATNDTIQAMAGFGAIASVLDRLNKTIQKLVSSIISGFKSASLSAIDFIEDLSRINNIFDKMGVQATALSEKIAKAFGLASDEGAILLADTSDLLIGFGFTEDQALKLSETIVNLGGSLASFRNMEEGVVGATESLSAGILGNRRNLRRLGIIVRQTDEDYKKAFKTWSTTNNFADKQAEILATLQLSYDQSQKSIGDFARTQEQAANRLRIFNSSLRELKLQLGVTAVEGFKLNIILKSLIAIVNDITNIWKNMSQSTKITILAFVALTTISLALTVAILSVASIVAILTIAVAALGAGGIVLLGITALLIAGIGSLAFHLSRMIFFLGEGKTFTDKFADGLSKMGKALENVIGFFINFRQNFSIFVNNMASRLDFALSYLIIWGEAVALTFENMVTNIFIWLDNMITAIGNIPAAIKAATTGGGDAAMASLMKGLHDTIDLVDETAKGLAELDKLNLSLQNYNTKFDISDIPLLRALGDIQKSLIGTGGGQGSDFKASSATVEGSVAAANLIAQQGGGTAEERTAAATEKTAAATNIMAEILDQLNSDGINVKNQGFA